MSGVSPAASRLAAAHLQEHGGSLPPPTLLDKADEP